MVVPLEQSVPLVAVVDDEESVCRAQRRLIRAAGLEAVAYTSGRAFLDSLKVRRPECVVLDVHMPEVTGFDVQAVVSRMRPPVPVVIITGRDTDETRQVVTNAGAVAYLCKPVDERSLLGAVAAGIAQGAARGG